MVEHNTPKAVLQAVLGDARSHSLTLDSVNNLHIPLYSSSRLWMEGFFDAGGVDVLNAAMNSVLDHQGCVCARQCVTLTHPASHVHSVLHGGCVAAARTVRWWL